MEKIFCEFVASTWLIFNATVVATALFYTDYSVNSLTIKYLDGMGIFLAQSSNVLIATKFLHRKYDVKVDPVISLCRMNLEKIWVTELEILAQLCGSIFGVWLCTSIEPKYLPKPYDGNMFYSTNDISTSYAFLLVGLIAFLTVVITKSGILGKGELYQSFFCTFTVAILGFPVGGLMNMSRWLAILLVRGIGGLNSPEAIADGVKGEPWVYCGGTIAGALLGLLVMWLNQMLNDHVKREHEEQIKKVS